MNTLIKVIVTIIISIFLCSCEFNLTGVDGNGNVVKDDRVITAPFNAIEVSHGLDVEISIGQNQKILVIADENIAELISTEVSDNTLYIKADKIIGSTKSKKIEVSVTALEKLQVSSGSHVETQGTVSADELTVQASSGSNVSIAVDVQSLQLNSSSGADLKVQGKTVDLNLKSSSGGSIDSRNLSAQNIQAKASSGGNAVVSKADNITVDESSGGHVQTVNTKFGSKD